MLHARVSTLLSRVARGRSTLSADELAINFSFVLHEASASTTVREAVRASHRHAGKSPGHGEVVVDGDTSLAVDTWLAPSLGVADDLRATLVDAGLGADRVVFIDRENALKQQLTFFRAPARLTLPPIDIRTVGIAALIVRPYGRTRQLILRGPFDWTSERDDAIRALESLIQAHVEQWLPEVQLWDEPAEALLPAEVRFPD